MNKLKVTILSLSLITVMSGAAVAPALGAIAEHFNNVNPLFIKLIITLPSLFIIVISLFFNIISKKIKTKTITIIGLSLYIIGGCGAGIADNIFVLLIARAILGIGVGLIMPLSVGLISFLFNKTEQSELLGYSSAMNNLGGIIASSLSGVLVSLNWRLSFLIYLLGLLVMILVVRFLPNTDMNHSNNVIDKRSIKKILPYAFAMFLAMVIFYTLPSNFSMIVTREKLVPTSYIGLMMSLQSITAFLTGMSLNLILKKLGKYSKYIAVVMVTAGFIFLSLTIHLYTVLIGLIMLGIGMGMIVPLLNSQISVNIEREKVTNAMAFVSAMLYLGQFLSPIIFDFLSDLFHIQSLQAPFFLAGIVSFLLLILFICIPIKVPYKS